MTKSEFIPTIAPIIKREAEKRGYKFPSAIIACAIIESNFGQSQLSAKYFNYFGLKCGSRWKGASVNMKTKEEYTKGTLTTIKDNFRAYDSLEAGVSGYFDFINTKRYANLKTATSAKQYCEFLKADGYATSSSYVNTLVNCMNKYKLYQYDGATATEQVFDNTGRDLTAIAKEVIAGKWGNGTYRKHKLTQAGYNYSEVQQLVNKMLR